MKEESFSYKVACFHIFSELRLIKKWGYPSDRLVNAATYHRDLNSEDRHYSELSFEDWCKEKGIDQSDIDF